MDHRENIQHLAGAGVSLIGAITARQEEFEWMVRNIAAVMAIVVSLATLWSIFFRKKSP